MSHLYGSRSPHGSYSRQNEEGQRNESPHPSNRGFDSHHRSRGRGRHPPGLRGKELGLWYRSRAIERAKMKYDITFKLPLYVQKKIETVLENSSGLHQKARNKTEIKKSSNGLEDKYSHVDDSYFKRKFLEIISNDIQATFEKMMMMKSKLERNKDLDRSLLEEYKLQQSSEEYESMLKFRMKLPVYQKKHDLLQLINKSQVVVISGETGCGKTTQIAQFILDDQIEKENGSITRIICTQPRRISAISIAERVASERAEKLGKSVGFQIRLEKIPPRNRGSILFCTTGILLQLTQNDPALREFSHVIIDEIHERTTESDFIISLLKLIIPKRPDLKILLMSATLNSEQFSNYYDNCPMIHIPGFTYPVQEYYLEDILCLTEFSFPKPPCPENSYRKYWKNVKQQEFEKFYEMITPYTSEISKTGKYPQKVIDELTNPNSEILSLKLIETLVCHISKSKTPGAILIFLPGIMDIANLNKMMLESGKYTDDKFVIYPLHSNMPTIDQKAIFSTPPRGIRKIIIATSIAETSITIEDVIYVIDCGKTKLSRFDADKNIQILQPDWVSLATAKQRRGRAGRMRPGYCYHLYSKARESTFQEYPLPEMARTRLENVILQIKMLQLGQAKQFLATVLDPPASKAIDVSIDLLRSLNALDDNENLTPLGYHLALLPLDARTGKMIIWAALFSCVEPIFAIAASLTFKNAFYCPLGKELEANLKKRELSMGEYSDHIALAEALRGFEMEYRRGNAGRYCKEYFLSFNTLKLLSDMKKQFAQYLCNMKFLDTQDPSDPSVNRNSHNTALIKAIVCAGLYPNIAVIMSFTNDVRGHNLEDYGRVVIHPSSVNSAPIFRVPSSYVMYFMKQLSTATYLHDTTFITLPILMFAASNATIRQEKGRCLIDLSKYLCIVSKPETATVVQKLRERLNDLLEYKISHPGIVYCATQEQDLLNAIILLVSQRN
ncbi:hypothetical protein KM043_015604 [Ampulex compressa]|nr:hypothetical protein KM043_015604 [Ampulex compressa]